MKTNVVVLTGTAQPLYNMIRYTMVLYMYMYITRFKDGSQKCINGHFSIYSVHFEFGYNNTIWIANMVYGLNPKNRLWCITN